MKKHYSNVWLYWVFVTLLIIFAIDTDAQVSYYRDSISTNRHHAFSNDATVGFMTTPTSPTDTLKVILLITTDSIAITSVKGYAIESSLMYFRVITHYLTEEKLPIPKDWVVWMSKSVPVKSERPRYIPTPQIKIQNK